MSWNLGIRVGAKAGIMISMYNVGLAQGRLYNTVETSSHFRASYTALMDNDGNGITGGNLVMESLVNINFLM